MGLAQEKRTSERPPVTLVLSESEEVRQPDTFRVCPLGIQFYSPHPLPEFEILEFAIRVPNGRKKAEEITCTGVVVHCRKGENNAGNYRIWVKFMDLPEAHRKRIKCVASSSELLCPYCENF